MIQALQKKFAKDPEKKRREMERMLNRSLRSIERERMHMEREEAKLIADIKKSAKQNQMGAVSIQAKDLVRTRTHIQKFHKMHAQLRAISLRMKTMKSTQHMAESMAGTAKIMTKMNQQMNIPQMQRIMMQFEQQSDQMDMKVEMMDDAIDDVMSDDEEEEKQVVSQVLEDIGLNVAELLGDSAVPVGALPASGAPAVAEGDAGEEDALMKRMEALRRA